jgi:hypothetical protein
MMYYPQQQRACLKKSDFPENTQYIDMNKNQKNKNLKQAIHCLKKTDNMILQTIKTVDCGMLQKNLTPPPYLLRLTTAHVKRPRPVDGYSLPTMAQGFSCRSGSVSLFTMDLVSSFGNERWRASCQKRPEQAGTKGLCLFDPPWPGQSLLPRRK